jgi:hypothetical protein
VAVCVPSTGIVSMAARPAARVGVAVTVSATAGSVRSLMKLRADDGGQ